MSWNAPNLPADKHRFFDRHGGVSNGRYESLNVNRKSADAPENIRQNINIAAGAFGMTAAGLLGIGACGRRFSLSGRNRPCRIYRRPFAAPD